jgi:HEAT repeat protein
LPELIGILKNYRLDGVRNDVTDGVDFALAQMGGEAVPAITEIAGDEMNQVVIRRRAVSVLHSIVVYGKKSEMGDAVKVLARISVNGKLNPELRGEAIRVLGSMKDCAAKAYPDLEKVLLDDDANIRYGAADALSLIDPKNPKIMATLLKALEEKDILTRMNAVDALGRCRSDPKEVVRRLRKVFQEDCVSVRLRAASALADMGSSARDALPDLRKALDDPEEAIRRAAKQAIETIEGK